MTAKTPKTPRSRVKSALRQLWLRSRERASALKREKYTCQRCGKKQGRVKGKEVKVEVHHANGLDWDALVEEIYCGLLPNPDQLEVLCRECHKELHHGKD